METILLIVQTGLVFAAMWYSWETRKIRIQNLDEIHILMRQTRLSLAPYLVPGAQKVEKEAVVSMIENSEDLDEEEKKRKIQAAEEEEVFYVVVVDNPTAEKVGCQLEAYIYDPNTKSFLFPDIGKQWISPGERELIQITGPYFTKEKLLLEIEENYDGINPSLLAHFDTPEDEGYVALLFRDIEGSVYLTKRAFSFVGGEMRTRPARLVAS